VTTTRPVPSTATSVDGRVVEVPDDVAADPLAEVLRAAGYTAVKLACGEGGCGGCTVQLDGVPVPSCVVPAARARGRAVSTAAELATEPAGAAVATELARRSALQCGFCIPGLLATTSASVAAVHAAAATDPNEFPPGAPTKGALDAATLGPAALDGHLCRCTGYSGLLAAVDRATTGTGSGTPARDDGWAKATGGLAYTADAAPPGTLTGYLLTCRSPHALVTVGPGTAMAVPGAVAVFGPEHAPAGRFSTNPHVDDPVFAPAEDAVFTAEGRFVGDVVGLVVAESAAAARAMAARVDQREEPLPAVTALDDARAAGAPPVRLGEGGNTAFELALGATADELAAALEAAVDVFSEVYEITPGPPAAMERPAALAEWTDGTCRIRSTSQTPQVVRRRLAALLELPESAVECEPVPLGGGFGLKEEVFLEPAAAVASRLLGGRPVLVEVTRAQLGQLRRRHGGRVTVTTGSAADGAMTVRAVDVLLDAGGQVGHSALLLENALLAAAQLYPAPVTRVTGAAVLTNTTNSGAYRGYGTAEVQFAVESSVDELARRAGVDPLEHRRRHVLRVGGLDALNGWPVASFAGEQCLDAVAPYRRHRLAVDPTGRWLRGRGLAMLTIVTAPSSAAHLDQARAAVRVDTDGQLVVETVVPDMGQGIHTTLTGVVAARLGLPQARVRVEQQTAGGGPEDEGTFASRGVYVTANAVADAADALRAALAQVAAERTGASAYDVTISAAGVLAGGRVLPLAELAGTRGEGHAIAPDNGLVAGAQLADVAVDTRTGRVVVERVVSAHDVGRVLDPDLARGQVVGGVVQGIGMALSERVRHDRAGRPLDVHLLDQAVPTAHSAPEVVDLYVGDGRARGLLGAKGLGEAPMVGVPAAVANAVADAIGVRLHSLPLDPESVLRALDEAATLSRTSRG
jgi:CO/xanthine dehydrogenase Mo-binding subunit/aerobic-type carbon monoxide dehydrogenase small subunit (CoxS/CutS family)